MRGIAVTRMYKPIGAAILAVGALALALGGCSSAAPGPDVREFMEESTGSTITYLTAPIYFVREQPGLAASGRDYIYFGPLEVTRGGTHSCWLWLATWSTVDRQIRNAGTQPLRLGRLQLLVDNEPMELDPVAADLRPAGLLHAPYATPVAPAEEFLIPVTRSQLMHLSRGGELTLVDRIPGGAGRLWRTDDRATLLLGRFAEQLGALQRDPGTVADR